jgi:transcription elongation factor GreA
VKKAWRQGKEGFMSERVPMTPECLQKLQEELKKLITVERPRVVQDIAEARDHGDLSENAEYDAAKDRQGFIEGRIIELQGKISHAQVIDPAEISSDKVVFGAKVKLYDTEADNEVSYQIVGEDEADIKLGKLSINSPVAKALIGHKVDDEVHIHVPSGVRVYEIIDIVYG